MSAFDSFDEYVALSRVTGLTLSVDGQRLVATIAALNDDGDAFVPSLWELDTAGTQPARRLTHSGKGESGAAFTADGDLLFLSKRDSDDDEPAALWQLPARGEARRIMSRPGGVRAIASARSAGTVVVSSPTLPGSSDAAADDARRTARKTAKVAAMLHTATPVRFWDHDLGPDELRLYCLDGHSHGDSAGDERSRELTATPGRALDEAAFALTPDGTTVVTSWSAFNEVGYPRASLVAIDTTSGTQRLLAEDEQATFTAPAVSADGRWVVCVREQDTTYDEPPLMAFWLVDLTDVEPAGELVADVDVWPQDPVFGADAGTLFFLADELGHRPVFRLDIASGAITRVTATGHYTALQVSADGVSLFALRDAVDSPPRPVRLDATVTDGDAVELPAPGAVHPSGSLERIATPAADGTVIHAWLALPATASEQSPAPLVLWMHGGPLGSWNSWSWRWNPWLMVAKGYAVLLPDPALSTGYGAQMIRRGWGEWGGAPFTDLMSSTDAAIARPDIDETKTAAMGGSYGGYLANWVAGHTDRFRCLVTHASLWALDQFQGTTDAPGYWAREWGLLAERPERYAQWSPHHSLDSITTPMLVIHGDKDYRVPVSEALRLWWDLQRAGVESSYLYFPDEGHWILKPGNARVWYETVWSWLAKHVHGAAWQQPDLL